MSSNHEILILGGNFGGVSAAHHLIRKTIPSLQGLDASKTFHVTIVTPNKQLFYKIASPRALINSELIPESKIIRPLSDGFSKYPESQFTLVQGLAKKLDPSARTVTIQSASTDAKVLRYDSLIIATGTTSNSPLWSLHADESRTPAALHSLHAKLPQAKSVLIAGGGPVGVETAGEISAAYPQISITLLSGGGRVLPSTLPATSARAEAYLRDIARVEVLHQLRVATTPAAAAEGEETSATVRLSDGSERTVDLYIDATGGKPNTDFVPGEWLDGTGRVNTRDGYFRAKGNVTDDVDGVYVLGDVVAGSSNTAMELDAQVPVVCSTLGSDVATKLGAAEKGKQGWLAGLVGLVLGSSDGTVQKEFKPIKGTIVVPIGTKGGVGQLMGWMMPSFMVKMIKGDYFITQVEPMLSGSKF